MSSNSTSTIISSPSSAPSYSGFVNRAEYLLVPCLQLPALFLISLPIFGQLFRRKMLTLKDGLANSLMAYQCAQAAFLLLSMPYNFYMLTGWLFNDAHFEVPKIFWLGLWIPAATATISCATFFLTLDRCFVLIWPTSYPKRRAQKMVTLANFLLSVAIFCANAGQTILLELPLDVDKASYCLNHPCVATKLHYKYPVMVNNVQCAFNLAISIFFMILLRHKTVKHQKQNGSVEKISIARNRIVIMTLVFEIFFKILPGLACTLVNNFTSILISDYLGWYIMLFTSIDTFAISLYYGLVLLKRPPFLCFARVGGENSTKSGGYGKNKNQQQKMHQNLTNNFQMTIIRSSSLNSQQILGQNSILIPSAIFANAGWK